MSLTYHDHKAVQLREVFANRTGPGRKRPFRIGLGRRDDLIDYVVELINRKPDLSENRYVITADSTGWTFSRLLLRGVQTNKVLVDYARQGLFLRSHPGMNEFLCFNDHGIGFEIGSMFESVWPNDPNDDGLRIIVKTRPDATTVILFVFDNQLPRDQSVINTDALDQVGLGWDGRRIVGDDPDWVVALTDHGVNPILRDLDLESMRQSLHQINSEPMSIRIDNEVWRLDD